LKAPDGILERSVRAFRIAVTTEPGRESYSLWLFWFKACSFLP